MYKSKKDVNYKGVSENHEEFESLMRKYVELGILREATEEEVEHCWISPLNCLEVRPGKFQIIHHYIGNACYREVPIDLVNILERGEILAEFEEYRTEDLSNAYLQFPLSYESMLTMGCRFDNKVYLWQTVCYGPSMAVAHVNSLTNLAASAAGSLFSTFCEVYSLKSKYLSVI